MRVRYRYVSAVPLRHLNAATAFDVDDPTQWKLDFPRYLAYESFDNEIDSKVGPMASIRQEDHTLAAVLTYYSRPNQR